MNKFGVLVAFLAFTLMSCTNQTKNKGNDNQDATTIDQTKIDSHTSETSLDWAGIYEGTMPCADCEGIETVIELKYDLNYVSNYTYLGKNGNTITNKGPFTWNDDGNSISLQAEGEATQYKVEENHIILLNADGEVITGEMANLYILKKKK